MAIAVSSVSVVQGTGGYVKDSVLEVAYTISGDAGHTYDMVVELKLTTAKPTWFTGYLYPTEPHTDIKQSLVPAGSSKKALVRVPLSLASSSVALANYTNELLVRVKARDHATGEESAWAETTVPANLKAKVPVVSDARMPQYIGGAGVIAPFIKYSAVPFTLTGNNGVTPTSGDPIKYRMSRNLADLTDGIVGGFQDWTASGTITFNDTDANGPVTMYVKAYDSFYNSSAAFVFTHDGVADHLPHLHKDVPERPKLRVVGTTGSEYYTGISIDAAGHFTPNRTATVFVSASSPLAMKFKILSTSNTEPAVNIGSDIDYSAVNSTQSVKLTTRSSGFDADNYNCDAATTVSVEIWDVAGNKVPLTATIRLNTRIYKAAHAPLRPQDAMYRHMLREVTSGGSEQPIPESPDKNDAYFRTWPDIFYPTTHSYPVDQWGEFDEANAKLLNGTSNSDHDAVVMNAGAVVYDEQGRPKTTGWTFTKQYSSMLSSRRGTETYWVIDNAGYGDYQLEFEWFDLDSNAYGPPYNPIAPKSGDVLVIYQPLPGALQENEDPSTGRKSYTLVDSTKLQEIAIYTGSGANVLNLTTGMRVGSNSEGGFKTDFLRNIPQVVLVLYTDASGNASGFKLKSSAKHQETWLNYHIDETLGEIWIHKHASQAPAPGMAETTTKKLIYDYLDQSIDIDLETGTVKFQSDPGGTVTADYTYYSGTAGVTQFLATGDDLVEYNSPNVYVLPAGEDALTDTIRGKVYEIDGYGRVTAGVAWDTDTGMLAFNDLSTVPVNLRIVAEYYHHTYQRLTNDGMGDLTFRDPVVVADETPQYPDYTFADIKLVNEGDAMLEDGYMKFVGRGYDTANSDGVILEPDGDAYKDNDSIKDQVLDIDRPWDIQKGTKDETYDRMACAFSADYIWDRSCPKSGGSDASNKSATGILSWKNKSFGDLAARGKLFGRVVWVLGGTSGNSYPTKTTSGRKRASLEIEGKYYTPLTA